MSLLDDARLLLSENVADNFDQECPFCGMSPSLHGVEGWSYVPDSLNVLHYSGCPWLSMPKIVVALEGVEEAKRDLRFLGNRAFREDHLAILSLADRVRTALIAAMQDEN